MGTLVAVGKAAGRFHDSSPKTHHESMLGGINWLVGKRDLCLGCSRSGSGVFSKDRDRIGDWRMFIFEGGGASCGRHAVFIDWKQLTNGYPRGLGIFSVILAASEADRSERVYQLKSTKRANMCMLKDAVNVQYLSAFAALHDVTGQRRK